MGKFDVVIQPMIAIVGSRILHKYFNRPKLEIDISIMNNSVNIDREVRVKVTNKGNKASMVDSHAFLMKDKTKYIFPDSMRNFSKKRLEPDDYFTASFQNESLKDLIENAEKIESFFVCDSHGKKWYPSKKNMDEFLYRLKKMKTQTVNEISEV